MTRRRTRAPGRAGAQDPAETQHRSGDPHRSGPVRRAGILIALLLLVAAAWLAGASWWPLLQPTTSFPGTEGPGLAQVLAFAPEAALALALLCLVLGAAALLRGPRSLPRNPRLAGISVVGMLVAALALVPAAAGLSAAGPADSAVSDGSRGRSLRVVEWNLHDEVTAGQLGRLTDSGPDVVVLPEATTGTIRTGLSHLGRSGDFQVFATQADPGFAPTTVLVAHRLGAYHQTEDRDGMLVLDPSDASSGAPRIVGVHTSSPSSWKAMRLWRTHLRRVVDSVCARAPGDRPVVAAGDFNAVTAHGPMAETAGRGCTDALPDRGVRRGTWPSSAPAPVRTQIDHVFGGPGVAAESAGLPEIDGASDHRPVSAELRYGGVPMPSCPGSELR